MISLWLLILLMKPRMAVISSDYRPVRNLVSSEVPAKTVNFIKEKSFPCRINRDKDSPIQGTTSRKCSDWRDHWKTRGSSYLWVLGYNLGAL
ncbi:hypothetical protein BDV39DRAFT_170425 [Aspergillus sergii]|uniref:Uncharacterized protein n=1 Tax=Aspergillus sergii TaxID=1034303 RepID=A0A5N6XE33_9EURO|nr:hypothetical protein BDV39DRAFT_170425 [Aspergillus sergii]